MKHINYKSDFDFYLILRSCDGTEIGWPDYDWTAKFYTSTKVNAFVASCIGGECVNCYNDGGRIHIVADNHHLSPGTLKVEFIAELPNGDYPDTSERIVTPEPLSIELVRTAAPCPSTAEIELVLPYIKGEPFRYEDFTPEQLAEFQRPAREAAVVATQAATAADSSTAKATSAAERAEAAISSASITEALIGKAEEERVVAETERCIAEEARDDAETIRREGYQQMQYALSDKADRSELSTVLAGDVISEVTAPEVVQFTRQELMWDLFDKMWEAAGGTIIVSGVRYGLNGLDDITANEALKIWRMSFHQHRKSWVNAYGYITGYSSEMAARYFCRTYFPLVSMTYEPSVNMQSIFYGNCKVEAVAIYGGYSGGGGHHNFASTFGHCRALRRVILYAWRGTSSIKCNSTTFQGCVNLERIEGIVFWGGENTLDLSMAPKFEIECIEKLVTADYSSGSNTIILHADTYAKVTDELLEAAAAKNITIATP